MKNIVFLFLLSTILISCAQKQETEKIISELQNQEKWEEIIRFAHENTLKSTAEKLALAYAYFNVNKNDSSVIVCNQILKKDSTEYNTIFLLGDNYFVLGNYQKSTDSYFVLENYQKAIANYLKAIKLRPNYAATYIHLGLAYIRTNEIEQAVSSFTEANKLLYQNELYDEVITISHVILDIDSLNIKAYEFLGEVYRYKKNGDNNLAYDYLKKALDISLSKNDKIESLTIRIGLGNLMYKNGNYTKSMTYLTKALEDIKDVNNNDLLSWSLYCNLSVCYNKLGNSEKALYFLNLAKGINEEETINRLKND